MSLFTSLTQVALRPYGDAFAGSIRELATDDLASALFTTDAHRREADRQIVGLLRRNHGDCREITELLRRMTILQQAGVESSCDTDQK